MYKKIIDVLFCTSLVFSIIQGEPVTIETNDGFSVIAPKQLITLSETWKKTLEFNNDQRGMQNTIKEGMPQQEIEAILSLFALIEQQSFEQLEFELLSCDMPTILSVLRTASYLLVSPLIKIAQKIVVQKLKEKEELEKFCADQSYSDALCLSPEMEQELAYLLLLENSLFKSCTQASEPISAEDNNNICRFSQYYICCNVHWINDRKLKNFLKNYSITLSPKITELLSHDTISEVVKHPTDFFICAFVSSKGVIYVWNSKTDFCTILDAHSSGLIAWHPKSSRSHILANTSYSFNGSCVPTITIWDTHTGQCLVALAHEGGFINDIAWHPIEEHILASTNGETIYFFNTGNKQEYYAMSLKSQLPIPNHPYDFPQIKKIRWQSHNLITRDTSGNTCIWSIEKVKEWYQCSFKQAMLLSVIASSLFVTDKAHLTTIALQLPLSIKECLKIKST